MKPKSTHSRRVVSSFEPRQFVDENPRESIRNHQDFPRGKSGNEGEMYGWGGGGMEDENEEEKSDRVYLFAYVRPLVCLGAFLGLFPLPKFYNRKGPEEFRYLNWLYAYSVLVKIVFLISISFAINYVIIPSFSDLRDFSQMLSFLFTVLAAFSSFMCLLINIMSHSKLGTLYHNFKEMDDLLPTSYGKAFLSIKYCGWTFILCFCLTEALYLSFEFSTKGNSSSSLHQILSLITIFNLMVTVAVPTFLLLHGAGLCLCTAMLYYNINEKIEELLTPWIERNKKKGDQNSNRKTQENNEDGKEDKKIVDDLEECRSLHFEVWSFSQKVSDYLSPQLIVVLSSEFLVICYNVYEGFVTLKSGEDNGITVMNFGTAIINLIAVGILSWSVDMQVDQHDNSSEILKRCRLNSSDESLLSGCLLRFSLQILQSRPELNVVGFFSVNRAFLLSMFGTLSTCVVILLQFNVSETSDCSGESNNSTNATEIYPAVNPEP